LATYGKDPAPDPGPPKTPPAEPLKLSPLVRGQQFAPIDLKALRAKAGHSFSARDSTPVQIDSSQKVYFVYNIEFKDAASCQAFEAPPGIILITRYDRFADIFMPAFNEATLNQAENQLRAADGWVRFEVVPQIGNQDRTESVSLLPATPVIAKETSKGLPEDVVHNGISGLTGKGVTIAVIDTGIDFRHPDFISYDAAGQPTSRVLYFWDTVTQARSDGKFGSPPLVPDPYGDVTNPVGMPPGKYRKVMYPNGDPIGIVYNRDELTAELRAPGGQPARIKQWDTDGQGTACAGIAAGNGNAVDGKKYAGVAPEADIIAVRIGPDKANFTNAYLLGVLCAWLDNVVGANPLVVSYSWSEQRGGHDGYLVYERQLDARFPSTRPGRAFCIAAGNDGDPAMHAGLTVGAQASPGLLQWQFNGAGFGSMELFMQKANPNDIVLQPGAGTTISNRENVFNNLTNQARVTFDFSGAPGTTLALSVSSISRQTFPADAYLFPLGKTGFVPAMATAEKIVGTPGTVGSAITVGSYDWNDKFSLENQIVSLLQPAPGHVVWATANSSTPSPLVIGHVSDNSNPGPRRMDQVVKPEIVAPGQWYTAYAAQNIVPLGWRDTTGFYQPFSGTSAATPYAAGVVALLLEKNPKLNADDIKALLKTCSTQDTFTGNLPNPKWGYGKLDFEAVQRMIAGKPVRN
jgi:subtilisin family serine protease